MMPSLHGSMTPQPIEAIIDTNVLVSGLLSSSGNCGIIIEMLIDGKILAIYSDNILAEYREVLLREKFAFTRDEVDDLLALITTFGKKVTPVATAISLPDENDRIFVDAQKASGAVIITGNIKHFPGIAQAMVPAKFLSVNQ
jgi:putative PIN family toxin of toxin-antitoxin system